jgi:hypothetical protein
MAETLQLSNPQFMPSCSVLCYNTTGDQNLNGIVAARVEWSSGGSVLISHTAILFVVKGENLYDAEDKRRESLYSIDDR